MGNQLKTRMFKTTLAASLVLIAAQATKFDQLYNNELSQTEEEYDLQPITCTEPGTYEYTTRDVSKQYFNMKNYQSLDAIEKQAQLWEMLNENTSVACQTYAGLEEVFRQKPNQSFDHPGDQMPTRML